MMSYRNWFRHRLTARIERPFARKERAGNWVVVSDSSTLLVPLSSGLAAEMFVESTPTLLVSSPPGLIGSGFHQSILGWQAQIAVHPLGHWYQPLTSYRDTIADQITFTPTQAIGAPSARSSVSRDHVPWRAPSVVISMQHTVMGDLILKS